MKFAPLVRRQGGAALATAVLGLALSACAAPPTPANWPKMKT